MDENMEKLIEQAVKKYVQNFFQNEGDGKTNLYEGQSVIHIDNGNLPIVLLYLFLNSQKTSAPSPSYGTPSHLSGIANSLDQFSLEQKQQFEDLLSELRQKEKDGS
ncbi:hypothetical protein [Falsibacillus pallidus]|uniref:Uncharacterized protein n=1 Tax=Falsibacillus pallidus TaxID=493781 RepID=A0A370GVZ7_9BACI|nr:hypothetical protein [Falsibacillus pallidus]RDI47711.1 hypothetical protein DFR59_101373 [Falsibacillus pallidus]